jgi:hypothetical protein
MSSTVVPPKVELEGAIAINRKIDLFLRQGVKDKFYKSFKKQKCLLILNP